MGKLPYFLIALSFGMATVIMPFFVMQPCIGVGFAACKTPKPNIARLRSLIAHAVFGIGLYGSALIVAYIINN